MSLPHALLGLLNYRPATGYELKATFTNSIHFFWDATLPQIYRTLKQMEGSGWLEFHRRASRRETQSQSLSGHGCGKNELQRWLSEPLETPNPECHADQSLLRQPDEFNSIFHSVGRITEVSRESIRKV